MPKAAIFDVDGTLVDSVDLHAAAWQEAFTHFGHDVSFDQVRSQIGKGGDKLVPVFLSEAEQADHGEAMESWRGDHFKARYLPLVRPFAAVPELLRRVREAGLKVAVGSSSKQEELETYLDIAGVADLVEAKVSKDDVEQSKPAPDIFQAAAHKLGIDPADAVAIGDSPFDAMAARNAGMTAIGLLSGGFTDDDLRKAGCAAVYPGPGALWVCFKASPLGA
jgi:beta-phosphoglucomutase-like phosphatase (HAD superfamily)